MIECVFAATLIAAFGLVMLAYHGAPERTNRVNRRGRAIQWDRTGAL